jgi:hypothetical protein
MYTIVFEDRTKFIGGEPNNSKWNDIPNKPIAKLQYSFGGKTIILEGYEAYNHIIKVGFLTLNPQKPIILAVIIMALEKNKVNRIIFDFTKQKIFEDIVDFGKEYNNKSVSGWKLGITNNKSSKTIN